jgi:phytanoyl-CoA hydroxylase
VYGGRGESHALGTELRAGDEVVVQPIARGDCTVHNERVMHGSGGNDTDGYRRAYVVAYRSEETVKIERELGFTHSHNDHVGVLDSVGVDGETRA